MRQRNRRAARRLCRHHLQNPGAGGLYADRGRRTESACRRIGGAPEILNHSTIESAIAPVHHPKDLPKGEETIRSHYTLQRILENALSQPQPLRRNLLDMARQDRSVRAELAASGELFNAGYEPRMARVHQCNAQRLRRIIEAIGWPGADVVGTDGAEAAWLILQHAISEPDLLRRALPLLKTAAREGRADAAHAAMLEDRIRFFEGRPQRYGTQLDWDPDGNLSPGELEDPQLLAERRAAVGLRPLEEQIEDARIQARTEGHLPPADYRAYVDARDKWAANAGWRSDV